MYRCEAGAVPAGHQEPTTSLYSRVRILLNSHANERNTALLKFTLPTHVYNSGTLNPYNYSNLLHNRLSSLVVSIKKNMKIIYLFSYLTIRV